MDLMHPKSHPFVASQRWAAVALTTLLLTLLQLQPLAAENGGPTPNTLTDVERRSGWRLLFDGADLHGWRSYRGTDAPATGWRVENGELRKLPGVKGGDLITRDQFTDFELSWEWWIAPQGNNGVKYLVTEERPSAPGHEYQMIDDKTNPDALKGAKRMTAAFYDVLPPAAGKPVKPAGEWNQSRILISNNRVEHWLNGTLVLSYELGSEAIKAAIAESKFKSSPRFGEKIRGHIMLTDHQDEARFRSIKIRELNR